MSLNQELPITLEQAKKVNEFLLGHYEQAFIDATNNTSFDKHTLVAIACQETAYVWYNWIGKHDADIIIQRCVFDATGDAKGTEGQRSAFPKNAANFLTKFSQDDLNILIDEANKTRVLRGFSPASMLYKGYGLFQYDLQFILTDKDFFLKKEWYSIDECIKRAMKELDGKYAVCKDVRTSIRMYNGSGQAAENYANNVMAYYNTIKQ